MLLIAAWLAATASTEWAVVTGASTGIGKELALEAAKRGYNVVLAARREPLLREVAAEIEREHSVRTAVVACDLDSEAGVHKLHAAAKREGEVSLLVANAGFAAPGDAASTSTARTRSMLALNVLSTTHVCQEFAADFVRAGHGKLLLTGSLTAAVPLPGAAAYGASKSYVRSFAGALRDELRPAGVSVTLLMPGATATDFAATAGTESAPAFSRAASLIGIRLEGADVARRALKATLHGRAEIVPGVLNKAHAALSPWLPCGLGRGLASFFFCAEPPWRARRRRASAEWREGLRLGRVV